ncbi:MAG: REP-associated tyrosine transposase, partial [Ignavibacteria bacterium]
TEIAAIIEEEFRYRINANEIKLICYCIMPDHIHALLLLTEQYRKSLQCWIKSFKRFTTKIVKERFGISKLWQTNFYEHIIRKKESLSNIAEYILNNPVRKKIVSEWNEYKYSKIFYD